MLNPEIERLMGKTPQQQLLRVLEQDDRLPPKVAQALLSEAEAYLGGSSGDVRPGQMRVRLARRGTSHARPMHATPTVEVIWTVDAGRDDLEVAQAQGPVAVRPGRLQRLVDEALEQGAVATQEDLARVLLVSCRTIKRDCAELAVQGLCVPTRGALQGIGRGQTHKAQMVGRWLQGETYDQIALHTRHSASAIGRYVQTFVRLVSLQQQGLSLSQMAYLLQISATLAQQYLVLYQQHDTPACRQRLAEHLARLGGNASPMGTEKGGP